MPRCYALCIAPFVIILRVSMNFRGADVTTMKWSGRAQSSAPRRPVGNALRALLLVASFSGGLLFGEVALAIGVF